MTQEKKSENVKACSLNDVMAFVRANAVPVLLRGALSLMAVVALLALYYAFAPRRSSWQQEIVVTLPAQDGKAIYPNEKTFSSADLLSAPVLNRVWCDFKLEGKVKFEDFCKWFSLVGYDRERAKLDAEYQTKMSKRNITVTELATLQREYESKLLAQAANNDYKLAMRPTCLLAPEVCAEIVAAVPRAWFDEYSILNAPRMPSVIRAEVLSSYVQRIRTADARALEMVDTLRLYEREISANCAYVRHQLLRGRNVLLDGVDIGAYEARLELVRAELLRFKNRVLVNGDPNDLEAFVASRLDDMACETMAAEEKMRAVRDTIDLLKDTSPRSADKTAAGGTVGKDNAVTLQADASFFRDFTDMVRRDANQESIQKYADELSSYARDMAEIKARKLYYDQISDYVKKARTRAAESKAADGSSAKLFADVERYSSEMLDIGAKVLAYRDRALKLYRTSDQFYALPAPAAYVKSFAFSPVRLALGLLALWALYNVIYLALAWNKRVG